MAIRALLSTRGEVDNNKRCTEAKKLLAGRAAPTSQAAEASPTSGLPRKCLDVGRSMGWRTKADRDIVRSGDLGRAAHRV